MPWRRRGGCSRRCKRPPRSPILLSILPMTRIDTPQAVAAAAADPADEIVAGPEVGYRWKHLIMAILMIAGGLWFAYDGWINWPHMNEMAVKVEKELEKAQHAGDEKKKEDLSIELRKY